MHARSMYAAMYRQRNRDWVREYLRTHPCVDCGEDDPVCLDFDHIGDNKVLDVALLVQRAYSLKRIQEEIAKCNVRCANCHRKITAKRRDDSSGLTRGTVPLPAVNRMSSD